MPIVRKQYKVIHKRSDSKGNFFIVEQEPLYGNWKLYVHLTGEDRRRFIGEIDKDNRVMLVRRDKSKHYHFQMRAYGFNYRIINDIADLQSILLEERDGASVAYYLIPVSFIKTSGVVKEFMKS